MNPNYRIEQDTDARNPRKEYDHLWTLAIRRIGDEEPYSLPPSTDTHLVAKVYRFEHGAGTTQLSLQPFSCPWDSACTGYAYVEKSKLRAEMGWKILTQKRIETALKALAVELEEYGQYLRGEVYGYIIEPDSDDEDSCWGFYGHDAAVAAAEEALKELYTERNRKLQEVITLSPSDPVCFSIIPKALGKSRQETTKFLGLTSTQAMLLFNPPWMPEAPTNAQICDALENLILHGSPRWFEVLNLSTGQMNIPLLRQMQEHLLDEHRVEAFHMSTWIRHNAHHIEWNMPTPAEEQRIHTCGTTACIAGHIALLAPEKDRTGNPGWFKHPDDPSHGLLHISNYAQLRLGLGDVQANQLFKVSYDPSYSSYRCKREEQVTAEDAVKAIENLINYGTPLWGEVLLHV